MSFSEDDKTWLVATIGDIVAGATTAIQQDLTLLKKGHVELREGQAELKQGLAVVRADVGDVRDIRHHVAALSHDAMRSRDREAGDQTTNDDRFRALEATVAELKAGLKDE